MIRAIYTVKQTWSSKTTRSILTVRSHAAWSPLQWSLPISAYCSTSHTHRNIHINFYWNIHRVGTDFWQLLWVHRSPSLLFFPFISFSALLSSPPLSLFIPTSFAAMAKEYGAALKLPHQIRAKPTVKWHLVHFELKSSSAWEQF